MSPRALLRLIAILFIAAGLFLTSAASSDPAPRDTWRTHHGRLVTLDIADTQKAGRRATLTIDGESGEPRFALTHIQDLPGIEEKLRALETGAPLAIDAVPRELAGWAAPEGEPLTLLVLKNGGEVIYDRDRDNSGGEWITTLVTVLGIVSMALGAAMILFSFRRRGTRL